MFQVRALRKPAKANLPSVVATGDVCEQPYFVCERGSFNIPAKMPDTPRMPE